MNHYVARVLLGGLTTLWFVTSALEFLLSGTWRRTYFRYGVPLFKQSYPVAAPGRKPTSSELELLLRLKLPQPLLFKDFSPSESGFRYSFLHPHREAIPVMHGLLTWDELSGTVNVTGYANWSVISVGLLFLLVAVTLPLASTYVWLGIALFVAGWILRAEIHTFARVGEIVATAWQASSGLSSNMTKHLPEDPRELNSR